MMGLRAMGYKLRARSWERRDEELKMLGTISRATYEKYLKVVVVMRDLIDVNGGNVGGWEVFQRMVGNWH